MEFINFCPRPFFTLIAGFWNNAFYISMLNANFETTFTQTTFKTKEFRMFIYTNHFEAKMYLLIYINNTNSIFKKNWAKQLIS